MPRGYSRWTHEEDEQLLFLREHAKLAFPEIDALLKRKHDAAYGRYRVLRPRKHRVKVAPDERRTKNVVEQQAARDQRAAEYFARQQPAPPRSLTSVFFGDPPPGRSALDEKLGAGIR